MAEVNNEIDRDPVIQELQSVLTREADRVSSETTGIEDTINRAIRQTRASGEATAARTESGFNRQINEAFIQGQRNVDAFQESRRGFGTQLTALRNLTGQTDNYLKDLAQRKEEALLLNDAETADRIAQLEVQGLQMKQKALQDSFNNLLNVSNFGLSARTFELGQAERERQFNLTYELEGEKFQLQKDQQSFAEKQAIAGVALEFGLEVLPTDTIDSIVDRAAATGIVNERQALELEQMRADIRNSNAQAAKALRQDPSEKPFDPVTAEILANAYMNGQTEFLAGLKTNEQYAAVIQTVHDKTETEKAQLSELTGAYHSSEEFLNAVNEQTQGLPDATKARITQNALQIAAETEFTPRPTVDKNFPELVSAGAQGYSESVNNFLEWLTGIERAR